MASDSSPTNDNRPRLRMINGGRDLLVQKVERLLRDPDPNGIVEVIKIIAVEGRKGKLRLVQRGDPDGQG